MIFLVINVIIVLMLVSSIIKLIIKCMQLVDKNTQLNIDIKQLKDSMHYLIDYSRVNMHNECSRNVIDKCVMNLLYIEYRKEDESFIEFIDRYELSDIDVVEVVENNE